MKMETIAYIGDRPASAADAYKAGNAPRVGWYSSSCGRIEIVLTIDDAKSGSQPGKDASDDIEALRRVPYIAEQLAEIKPDDARRELRETGAWSDDEMLDHEVNLTRVLWLACGDINENQFGE